MKTGENGIIDSRYNESTAPATVQAQGRGKMAYIAVSCVLFWLYRFLLYFFICFILCVFVFACLFFLPGASFLNGWRAELRANPEKFINEVRAKYEEFVNEPRGNDEKNKISPFEAARTKQERTKRIFKKTDKYPESYRT